jgi:hypothetical protein
MRSTTRILAAAFLAALLPGPQAIAAADAPSHERLLALSMLELLHAQLDERTDPTLGELVDQAAATVHFPKDRAGAALADLIGGLGGAEQAAENAALRREIVAQAAKPVAVAPDTMALFTNQLLLSIQTALTATEEIFLDEIIAETAAAVDLNEPSAHGLTMRLAYAAAQKLRPRPPAKIGAVADGVYVLAVHFQPSARERSIVGVKLRPWDEQTRKNGAAYSTEQLSRSMTMKRKFRRIIPCYNMGDARTLLADYLLVLHVEEEVWDRVQDTRTKERSDPEDLLAPKKKRSTQQEPVYQVALELQESIELLPGGKKVWSARASLKHYMDELSGRALRNASSYKREDWIISHNSPLLGILDVAAARFLKDFRKVK